jgi:hypothetical protein
MLYKNYKYGYIRKNNVIKIAIKHQYELKQSDIIRVFNEYANFYF